MQYLRAFSSITSGNNWFTAPLVFAAISFGLFLFSLIPFVGVLFSLVNLLLLLYIQGWCAAVQRRHAVPEETGLPDPFDAEYILPAIRVFVIAFLFMLPVMAIGMFSGVAIMVASDQLDRSDRETIIPIIMGLVGLGVFLYVLVVTPIMQISITRTNLANDWSGLRVGESFATFTKVIVESYLGMIIWWFVGVGMILLGFLMCFFGIYFMQPLLYASMAIFWVDVVRLAVERGAPPLDVFKPKIDDVARTFA